MFEQVIKDVSTRVPMPDTQVNGKCSVCGERLTMTIKGYTVNRMCACVREKVHERQKRTEYTDKDIARKKCFAGNSKYMAATFESSEDKESKPYLIAKGYANKFRDMKKQGKGLLLWGTVGSGKSYLSACIANELIDKGYSVLYRSFVDLATRMHDYGVTEADVIDDVCKPALFVLDDLGAERKTEWMQEKVLQIINARLERNLPIIVTTNITLEDMANEKETQQARIYNRVMEMCNPVKVVGSSWRTKALKDRYKTDMEMLEESGRNG